MADYFNHPLNEEYTFAGKFSDSSEPEHDYGGLIKFRPGYLSTLQLATSVREISKEPETFYGQVFQDGQPPKLCTLTHRSAFNNMAGFSNAGFKVVGFYKYIVIGNCLDDKDIITSYNYSNQLVQSFFAPKGHKYEEFSRDKLTFTYNNYEIDIWQYASINIFSFLSDTEFTSCSKEFKEELSSLLQKHKGEDGFGPGIKKKHIWIVSVNQRRSINKIDDFAHVCNSLDTLFFILTGHRSAPIGAKIDVLHEDESKASYDVLVPVTTKLRFDKNYDNYSDRFDLYHAITYKTLGPEQFQKAVYEWESKEDEFHYIIQTLKSNYSDRRDTHSAYIFSRSVDALEAICEIDGAKCRTQAAKIGYAIDNYGSAQTQTYFSNTAGKVKAAKNTLASERGKIVHPKSSHKGVWDDQKQFYNWAIAIDAILHSYIQVKIGIDPALSFEFQDKMLKYTLWA